MSTQRSSFETVDFTMGQSIRRVINYTLCMQVRISAINVDVYILIGGLQIRDVEIYMKKWSGQESNKISEIQIQLASILTVCLIVNIISILLLDKYILGNVRCIYYKPS